MLPDSHHLDIGYNLLEPLLKLWEKILLIHVSIFGYDIQLWDVMWWVIGATVLFQFFRHVFGGTD